MSIMDPILKSLRAIAHNPKALLPVGIYYVAMSAIFAIIVMVFPTFWLGKLFFSHSVAAGMPAELLSTAGPTLLALLLLVAVFVFYIPSVLLNGVFIGMGRQLATGSGLDIRKALAPAERKYADLFIAGIVFSAVALAIIGVFLGIAYVAVRFAMPYAWPIAAISVMVMAALLIFSIVYFFLINAAIILDGKNVSGGIRRSFNLASLHGLEIFMVLVSMGVVFAAVDALAAFIAVIPVFGWLIYFAASMFLATWFGVLPAFVYYDLAGSPAKQKKQKRRGRRPSMTRRRA